MEKVLDFNTYKHLMKKTYNQVNQWVISLYQTAFSDGIKSVDKVDVEYDELVEVIKSVKGIGEKRAVMIADAIYKHYAEDKLTDNPYDV